ncbi:hypothetical protein D3C76_1450570 [compost metagenome]
MGMGQNLRQIPQPDPRLVLPMQHAHRQLRPLQQAEAGNMISKIGILITHHRNDLIGQPLAKAAVFGGVVMHQCGVGR